MFSFGGILLVSSVWRMFWAPIYRPSKEDLSRGLSGSSELPLEVNRNMYPDGGNVARRGYLCIKEYQDVLPSLLPQLSSISESCKKVVNLRRVNHIDSPIDFLIPRNIQCQSLNLVEKIMEASEEPSFDTCVNTMPILHRCFKIQLMSRLFVAEFNQASTGFTLYKDEMNKWQLFKTMLDQLETLPRVYLLNVLYILRSFYEEVGLQQGGDLFRIVEFYSYSVPSYGSSYADSSRPSSMFPSSDLDEFNERDYNQDLSLRTALFWLIENLTKDYINSVTPTLPSPALRSLDVKSSFSTDKL